MKVIGQQINLLVNSEEEKKEVTSLLRQQGVDLSLIKMHIIPTQDTWIRDYGPTFIVDKKKNMAMIDWIFNAWGEKYDELMKDNGVPKMMNQFLKLQRFVPEIVLEGGSIDVNGKGLVLTSEQCLLNKNRNPTLNRKEIEQKLQEFLNVEKVLWLKEGIVGDDTDGHIDDIARFVDEKTIVCAYEDNEQDDNHLILKENYELLLSMKNQKGELLRIVKMPMPDPVVFKKKRLPASYLNFYIGNKVVVVPTFRCNKDQQAIKILEPLFPDRKVIGIDCTDLVFGLGTLHCCSQQQPRVK